MTELERVNEKLRIASDQLLRVSRILDKTDYQSRINQLADIREVMSDPIPLADVDESHNAIGERLTRAEEENENLRRTIVELTAPKDTGDEPSPVQQAYAWTQVHRTLNDVGMLSFLPTPLMGPKATGLQRAIQFIHKLSKDSELLKKVEDAAKADEEDLAKMRDGTKLSRSGVVQALFYSQEEIRELKEKCKLVENLKAKLNLVENEVEEGLKTEMGDGYVAAFATMLKRILKES